MTNGKFALCLAGGLFGGAVISVGTALALSDVLGEQTAWSIGFAVSGGLGATVGVLLVRSGNRRSEERRRAREAGVSH